MMERVHLYLDAIEEINRAERRLDRFADAEGLTRRQSAVDAARAAWLGLPAEWQVKLEPPPEDLV